MIDKIAALLFVALLGGTGSYIYGATFLRILGISSAIASFIMFIAVFVSYGTKILKDKMIINKSTGGPIAYFEIEHMNDNTIILSFKYPKGDTKIIMPYHVAVLLRRELSIMIKPKGE